MARVIQSADKRIPQNAELLSINNHVITDVLDYIFYNDHTKPRRILFSIGGRKKIVHLKPEEDIRLKLEQPVFKSCENDCAFCFVKGLPQGLRKEVYFRDDDYRLSFLFGNFLSLTNLTDSDIRRISRLHLSPLYVSVHTTNPQLRVQLFKNKKAELILEQLKKLTENGIMVHCQIVVLPGLTDGENIKKTVNDLATLYPGVYSVGIVPVGRTKFLSSLPTINNRLARKLVSDVTFIHNNFKKKFGRGFVYLADEFYINSQLPIPESSYYDDFVQYENGIGMIRRLLNEINSLNKPNRLCGKFLFVTGKIAYPYITILKEKLTSRKCRIDLIQIKNQFFGDTVSVAGLLVGQDIYNGLKNLKTRYDWIILPPNCVNDNGEFLDDFKFNNKKFFVAPYSIKELVLWLQ